MHSLKKILNHLMKLQKITTLIMNKKTSKKKQMKKWIMVTKTITKKI